MCCNLDFYRCKKKEINMLFNILLSSCGIFQTNDNDISGKKKCLTFRIDNLKNVSN